MEQKMKITFVLPAIGKKKGKKYIKTWKNMEKSSLNSTSLNCSEGESLPWIRLSKKSSQTKH